MNLDHLIPSLKIACASALTNHAFGTLSKNSAVAVAFDKNGGAHILYIDNTSDEVRCPAYIVNSTVIFGGGLSSFVDSITELKLEPEQAVDRMAFAILSLLAGQIYELRVQDDRLIALAKVLSTYAVNGIVACIAHGKNADQQQVPVDSKHPERN